jgi:DNA-binding winged helix-turn-helix (wHTH) protein
LLRDEREVPLTSKAFEMLLMLVERAGHVVEKEELMRRLWPNSYVEEGNLTVHKSALVKALGEGYIQTVPRRGYRFMAVVEQIESVTEAEMVGDSRAMATQSPALSPSDSTQIQEAVSFDTTTTHAAAPPQATSIPPSKNETFMRRRRFITLAAFVLACFIVVVFVWRKAAFTNEQARNNGRTQVHSPTDEAEIKRVVKESQMFEFLTLDTAPAAADESLLSKYWVPAEQGGKEIQNVRTSMTKLLSKGWHYGKDSRVELLIFVMCASFLRKTTPKREHPSAGICRCATRMKASWRIKRLVIIYLTQGEVMNNLVSCGTQLNLISVSTHALGLNLNEAGATK